MSHGVWTFAGCIAAGLLVARWRRNPIFSIAGMVVGLAAGSIIDCVLKW
jgi:hypothetical protein